MIIEHNSHQVVQGYLHFVQKIVAMPSARALRYNSGFPTAQCSSCFPLPIAFASAASTPIVKPHPSHFQSLPKCLMPRFAVECHCPTGCKWWRLVFKNPYTQKLSMKIPVSLPTWGTSEDRPGCLSYLNPDEASGQAPRNAIMQLWCYLSGPANAIL